MLSTTALRDLRLAATLTHSLPGLRARIAGPAGPLLEVAVHAPDRPASDRSWARRTCTPCQLRSAVGRAVARTAEGERLAFLGLPAGVDPTIELVAPAGGEGLVGGRFRVAVEGRWWRAFASTLPIDVAHELGRELADGWPELAPGDQLRLRWDPRTEVTLAYIESDAVPGSSHEVEVQDLLDALLARWAVAELLDPAAVAPAPR